MNKQITNQESLHVYSEKGIRNIPLNSITHVSSNGPKSMIHCTECAPVSAGKGIGELESLLAPLGFFRIHKSCLVNLNKIDRFTQTKHLNRVVVSSEAVLPVSRQRKTEFIRAFRKTALASI